MCLSNKCICLLFVCLLQTVNTNNLSSNETFNTSLSDAEPPSSPLTLLENVQNENTQSAKVSQKNYLDDIFKKLEEEKARQCEYGSNPKIAEICSDFSQAVS